MSETPSVSSCGPYELLERIGVGGMAEVFRARRRGEDGFTREVAVKRILPQLLNSERQVRMFMDEARILSHLDHPNIAQVIDFGCDQGSYYLVMELIDGIDLSFLRHLGMIPLASAMVAHIGEAVAAGLDYAHRVTDPVGKPLRLVHRDVSPHNIMLTRSGCATVMDFGIAKAEGRLTRTTTEGPKGKLSYMAPEQAAGRPLDGRCDQFALGLVLWELLTGRRFYDGDELSVTRQIVKGPPHPLPWPDAVTPPELRGIVGRCLSTDPEQRYPTLGDVSEALVHFRFSLGPAGNVELSDLVNRALELRLERAPTAGLVGAAHTTDTRSAGEKRGVGTTANGSGSWTRRTLQRLRPGWRGAGLLATFAVVAWGTVWLVPGLPEARKPAAALAIAPAEPTVAQPTAPPPATDTSAVAPPQPTAEPPVPGPKPRTPTERDEPRRRSVKPGRKAKSRQSEILPEWAAIYGPQQRDLSRGFTKREGTTEIKARATLVGDASLEVGAAVVAVLQSRITLDGQVLPKGTRISGSVLASRNGRLGLRLDRAEKPDGDELAVQGEATATHGQRSITVRLR